MEQNEALKVLVEVAKLAQSKGILTLEEAVIVHQACLAAATKKEVEEIEVIEVIDAEE